MTDPRPYWNDPKTREIAMKLIADAGDAVVGMRAAGEDEAAVLDTVAAAVGRAARARRPPSRSARRSICYGASRKTDAASGAHKDKTSGFLPFHGAGSAVGSIMGSVVARKGVVSPSMPGPSETLSALEQRLARVQARVRVRVRARARARGAK